MKHFTFIVMMLLVVSCSNKEKEAAYEQKISSLEQQLDECMHGAEKLVAIIEKAYTEKDYLKTRKNIELLYEKHPESAKNKEFEILLITIEKEELEEQKRRELEDRERIRLENLNNTGMWSVGYYVDEFGEKTNQAYISNTMFVEGTFSNTATQDSKLNVDFLISNSDKISFQLYEYAGNNPVKAYSTDNYRVLIQDNEGNRYKLTAANYSDRLTFDKTTSKEVHNILMKGGSIKFKVIESKTPTTQYEFTILKADWYENAYKKLQES